MNDYYRRIKESDNAKDEIGFASHLNCADELHSDATVKQIASFEQATQVYSNPKSLSNSAGILHRPDAGDQVGDEVIFWGQGYLLKRLRGISAQ